MNTYNRRKKILGSALEDLLIQDMYGIKPKCETAENPQEKFIVE